MSLIYFFMGIGLSMDAFSISLSLFPNLSFNVFFKDLLGGLSPLVLLALALLVFMLLPFSLLGFSLLVFTLFALTLLALTLFAFVLLVFVLFFHLECISKNGLILFSTF